MKLAELFHKPTAPGAAAKPAVFDNGDLVVQTSTGEPGQIMSMPDAKGCYKVKLKNGKTELICGTDLELSAK